MKIMVTGAAGQLGSRTVRVLHEAGHEVVATDRAARHAIPVELHVADLLDRHAMTELARGIDAVAHLGNHTDFSPPDPQMIFNENMTMNMNVLQAAIDGGARKIVFASSIQVVASLPKLSKHEAVEQPAYLPLDSDSPAVPTNPYALSKRCGEVMLEYFTRVYQAQTVAIRFPWMFPMEHLAEVRPKWQEQPSLLRQLALSYMSYDDGATLVAAIMATDLPGHRIYLPASRHNLAGLPAREIIEKHLPNVPLRRPLSEIESTVDISRIVGETGWSPKY